MALGFRLSIDLATSAAALECLSCQGSHEVDADDHDVVLAAMTTAFVAAHARCPQPVVA